MLGPVAPTPSDQLPGGQAKQYTEEEGAWGEGVAAVHVTQVPVSRSVQLLSGSKGPIMAWMLLYKAVHSLDGLALGWLHGLAFHSM